MEDFVYKPLISIIIPVYNTSKYLKKCLNSVIKQDYTNIEIICINDCSTDESLEILEDYRTNNNRIVLLNNEKNLGAGLSRNKGLEIANGEYVFFVDSDDWLEHDACSGLVKILNEYGIVDVISFKLKYVDCKSGKICSTHLIPNNIENKIVNIFNYPDCIEYVEEAVSKLLNRNFLIQSNIIYKDYKSLEDVEYAVDIMTKADSIIFTNNQIYNYRANREGSVVSRCDYYINALEEAVKKADNVSQNFPANVRNKLLSKLYRTLLYSAYTSYYHRILSFTELKNIFESVDINILKAEKLRFYLTLYDKIQRYSPLYFRVVTTFKLYIKETLPFMYDKYMKIKKRIGKN